MILITQPIFGVKEKAGKKIVNLVSIINYGEKVGNGKIKYLTKEGEKIVDSNSLPNSIKLFELNEICLENLMNSWKRINREFEKPIVLDENIDTNEVYTNKFSPLNFMIERRKNEIAIKPIFE